MTRRTPGIRALWAARGAAFLAAVAGVAEAQMVRGTIVDAAGTPVPGVIVRLIADDSSTAARALTDQRGDFTVSTPRPGRYRLSTLRIGFRPLVSDPISLAAGQVVQHRVEVTGIALALSQVRITADRSCGRAALASAQTADLLEQMRAAITATALTRELGTIRTTSVTYRRALDAAGRRVLGQSAAIRSDSGGQPWRAVPADSLRRLGYVIDAGDSLRYLAPGLETLASAEFVADHCFRLARNRDTSLVGIAFEPIRERRTLSGIRGTLWLDRASSELRSLEYRYANVETAIIDAGAGGDVGFVRMRDGSWAVSHWSIRMPVLGLRSGVRLRGARTAGQDVVAASQIDVVGGRLSVVTRAGARGDTLWSRTPLSVAGTVTDSTSDRPVPGARIAARGTSAAALSNSRGQFVLSGMLPGNYTLEVRTPSLDSVNAVNALAFALTDSGPPIRIRVPNAAHVATALCGSQLHALPATLQGIVFGAVVMAGDTLPSAGAHVAIEWTEGADDDFRWKDATADARGHFRFCGVPIGRTLVVRAMTDSASAEAIGITIARDRRFARAELSVNPSVPGTGVFAGLVVRDSAERPIEGAEVVVQKAGKSGLTNGKGAFRLREIPVGTHDVVVRKVGYGPMTTQLTFTANRTVTRRIVLTPVQMLGEVRVTATRLDPAMARFEANRKLGLGRFWTRADLESLDGLKVGSLLESAPGVTVFEGQWLVRRRGVNSWQSAGKVYQGETLAGGATQRLEVDCPAMIYLDRTMLYAAREGELIPNLRSIAVESIEAIEYYPGPASTPAEYSDLNSNCGVLVLHTRRVESREQPPPRKPPGSD
jgi:hypothetical protein